MVDEVGHGGRTMHVKRDLEDNIVGVVQNNGCGRWKEIRI